MSGLPAYHTTVIDDWIDYNDHLSEAFYVLIFGYATDAVMEQIGLGPDERRATGSSLYVVEAHIRYLREVNLNAPRCTWLASQPPPGPSRPGSPGASPTSSTPGRARTG